MKFMIKFPNLKLLLKNKAFIFVLSVLILILGAFAIYNKKNAVEPSFGSNTDYLAGDLEGSQWFVYNKFDGYQTKADPEKVSDGANPQGQNTSINFGDRISNRNLGYELFPETDTYASSTSKVISLHTFRKRDGENIMMRKWGDQLEWFDVNGKTWEQLSEGYSTSTSMDFADFNINTDLSSYVYFGDGVADAAKWNGAHTNLSSALVGTEDRIEVDDVLDQWTDTGSVVYCGQTSAYSFLKTTGTPAFVLTGTASACADGEAVAQATTTDATDPKGNIYLVADNRLFISGVASSTQAIFFSAYGDADNFSSSAIVSSSTDAAPGIFNLGEGGGGVVGLVQDEGSVYAFKKSIIYKISLDDTTYSIVPLKTFDGKSQTTGAISKDSIFAGGNGIFFVTPDNQIMNLSRIENYDYPQIVPISDIIKPTVDAMRFASSTGIVFRDKAFFSVRSDNTAQINDTVLVWNISTKNWDSPIVGWNVSDWTVYNNDYFGNGLDELYFGDDTNANVFKVNESPLDYIYSVKSNWRSKAFDFGLPYALKEIDNIFIEGYIADNTELTISLLLNDNGFTQIYQTVLKGNETTYLFKADDYNVFGFSAFGTKRFGTNDTASGVKKFRVYLNKNLKRIPFYTAQLEFASDGENQNWEILNYGFNVRKSSQPMPTNLMRIFN